MQSYRQLLAQLAASLHIEAAAKDLEKELINAAFRHVQANKTIYTVMDEAHLLDMNVLRQLRLLFERFPKKHNLVLLAQPELLHGLAMMCNEDIKSRITYSKQLQPLTDETLTDFIVQELAAVELGVNTFDDGAVQVILRAVQGNLRLCGNLCYASLIQACLDSERIVTIQHVNAALTQPHWRSQDALLKQQKARELA